MGRRKRLYRRGDVWWCWFYDHAGRRHRASTHQRDRALAGEAARRIERDRLTTPEAGPTLTDAIAEFMAEVERRERAAMTISFYEKKAVPLLRGLGAGRDVETLSTGDVNAYVDARRAQGAKRATNAKELGLLRSVLLHVGVDPRKVKGLVGVHMRGSYTPRERALSHAEYKRLWLALSRELRDFLVVYCNLGVRESELYQLTGADLEADMVHVRGKKTSRADRWIPLTREARTVLERRAGARENHEPLFPRWRNARRDLRAACVRAKIAPVSHNDLRRTFASWLCERGVPELVTASLLGHASSAMVRRVYARIGSKAQRAAVATLPALSTVTAGVTEGAGKSENSGRGGKRAKLKKPRKPVPRDGVEPPTRGFSGPTSASRKYVRPHMKRR